MRRILFALALLLALSGTSPALADTSPLTIAAVDGNTWSTPFGPGYQLLFSTSEAGVLAVGVDPSATIGTVYAITITGTALDTEQTPFGPGRHILFTFTAGGTSHVAAVPVDPQADGTTAPVTITGASLNVWTGLFGTGYHLLFSVGGSVAPVRVDSIQ